MTAPDTIASSAPRSAARRTWPVLKWLLFGVVIWFVGRRAYVLWEQDKRALYEIEVHVGWLVLAGVVYVLGWLPSVWYWRTLMQRLGGTISFRDTLRAYYCGHLGKYVPGKAAVLVIRSAMMKERGSGAAAAAVSATIETLLMIGTGAAVALALTPLVLTDSLTRTCPAWLQPVIGRPGTSAAVTIGLLLLAFPVLSHVLTYIAERMTPRAFLEGPAVARIETKLVAGGVLAFIVSWAVHGLTLGLTLRAVSGKPLDLADWPVWTGSVAAATVAGFVVILAPGGLGVREGLLIELLRVQPGVGSKLAIAAAVLLRVVWFLAEITAAVVLYYMVRPRPIAPPNDEATGNVTSSQDPRTE